MRVVQRSAPTALVRVVESAEYNLPATTEQARSFLALYELLFPRLSHLTAGFLGPDSAQRRAAGDV
jgi:hypothetical protein